MRLRNHVSWLVSMIGLEYETLAQIAEIRVSEQGSKAEFCLDLRSTTQKWPVMRYCTLTSAFVARSGK